MLHLDTQNLSSFITDEKRQSIQKQLVEAHQMLCDKTGAGNDFLGWLDLVLAPNDALISDIEDTARKIRQEADVFVIIGIGGSYLGAKAIIDALTPYFPTDGPEVLFAGHHMSGAYLTELLTYLEGKSVYVNVISKSGTTLEPALSFRKIRTFVEQNFDNADERIIITTDPEKGALNELRKAHPYKKYVIPGNVGGRFSVLTPVGLLPIAVAGIDIRALFYGAVTECKKLSSIENNTALEYVAVRYLLLNMGFNVDVLANFEAKLTPFGGWWQQLFGESEGKNHKGFFPASVQYSTDLHSLGQYMQDGQRKVIETFLMVKNDNGAIEVDDDKENLDRLNYLSGKSFTEINKKAYEGTARAHTGGGVPNMTLWLDALSPEDIGACIYFFEHAVAVSGYLMEINPFDQPGVEDYKKEMFRLLDKPGTN